MECTRVKILRPGLEATGASTKSRMVALHRASRPSLAHHGGDEQQAGIGHEIRVIEGHDNPVDSARYWLHRKCLLCW